MKRYIVRRMLLLLLILALSAPQSAEAGNAGTAVFSASGAIGVQARTASDLRQAWEAIRVPGRRFDETPSAVYPYRLGRLSVEFLQQNLDMLNFIRLAAGLPPVNDTAANNTDAQYGAVVLAAANTLSHEPPRAPGMDADFYQRGCGAVRSGNISVVLLGGPDAASIERNKLRAAVPMIMRNYMDGYGAVNRSSVSHRRWILYPALQSVGFGCADAADTSMYQVLKVVSAQSSGQDYDFISWPASGSFPTQVISPDAPWSITLNPEKFRTPDRAGICITVTRQSDGRVWTLNASSPADSAADSFLLVDTQRFGVNNCILFAFPSGDKDACAGDYQVRVTGLTTRDGRQAVLDYGMHFVDLENCDHTWMPWTVDTQPTCSSSGLQHRLCSDCGERQDQVLQPLGHDWVISAQVEQSTKYRAGTAEFTCSRCGWHKLDALPLIVCQDADCPCKRFTDAPPQGNWAHNGIDFVVENGIFNGTGASTFHPGGNMTRAMLVTVLWRIAGKPEAKKDYTFTDVHGSAYYAPAVRWASENGVVTGYSPERFGPENYITREQAVTLLQRYFAPDAVYSGSTDRFMDAQSVQPYVKGPMSWAIEHRVITGQAGADGAMYLMPGSFITREQAASVIMRCLMNLNENQPEKTG